MAFHKQWFGPNNATLFVVGDTTMAQITPKLEAALARLGATRLASASRSPTATGRPSRRSISSTGPVRYSR